MRELVARCRDAFPQVTATIPVRAKVPMGAPTVALWLLSSGSSRLMRGSRVRCALVELVPGQIPDYLLDDSIGLLRADDRVFEAMLDGWRAQQLARGLTTAHIKTSSRMVTRFQEHANEYPWTWMAHHFEEFLADLRTSEPPLKVSTLRSYTTAIRAFTRYVSDTRYGWVAFCDRVFDDIPAQIVFDWNSPRHSTDDDVPTGRRALTRHEMQSLFDAADDFVDAEYAKGSKRWLPALRDSTALKVAYAYGLRRRELTKLEYVDFGPNPKVPAYRNFGAVQVRWAKGMRGSGPRRRTVLTTPEFDWVVDLLQHWLSPAGRELFPTADRSRCLWPSERAGAASLRTFERAFARARERVGHQHASTTSLYTSVSSYFKQKTIQQMINRRLRIDNQDGGHDG